MSRFSRITSFLLFLLVLNACRVMPEALVSGPVPAVATDTASVRLAQRMDDFIHALVPHSFNGAILVEKEGDLILANGYGRIQAQDEIPFSTKSITHTAYLVQQITAAAVLKLQEQGALRLSDTLAQFFNALPVDKQGISLQQLLTHRAGFTDYPVLPHALLKKEFLDQVWQQPLKFKPGTDYHFSGTAYGILAAVIEEASGHSYEVYVRQSLLNPAGMVHTGYVLPEFHESSLAKPRNALPAGFTAENYQALYPALWYQLGNSGMLSTAEDLYRWQKMLFHGQLLKPLSLSNLWENRGGVPEGKTAFGWALETSPAGNPVLVHNSQVDGFACQVLYDPQEKILILLVANQFNRQVEELGDQLARMLYHPYYIPALLPYSEESFVRLPQGPGTEHLGELMQVISTDQVKIPGSFVQLHYSTAFRRKASEHAHLNTLHQLQERLADAQLIQTEKSWPYYMLTFSVPENRLTYLLKIGVEQHAPHYISSIELEITDSYP
jgi:CubicO group peptidase (beta-lactamase class C family)